MSGDHNLYQKDKGSKKDQPMVRYIVSLGWEGFGDRLQCLSYCIDLALTRNRILIVNWSDRWFGGFDDYFQLVNIPYTDTCPPGKTHPSIFEHLRNVPADYWVYDLVDQSIDNSSAFIVVHPGVGVRTYNYHTLEKHLRFTPQTALEVAKEVQRIREMSLGLPVVHLRGTDRPWTPEQVHELAEKHGEVVLLSDDQRAVDAYLSVSKALPLSVGREDGQPIHKVDPSRERVIRMLTDFCLISERGVDALNKESLFWSVAKFIDVGKWFKNASEPTEYDGFYIRHEMKMLGEKTNEQS